METTSTPEHRTVGRYFPPLEDLRKATAHQRDVDEVVRIYDDIDTKATATVLGALGHSTFSTVTELFRIIDSDRKLSTPLSTGGLSAREVAETRLRSLYQRYPSEDLRQLLAKVDI